MADLVCPKCGGAAVRVQQTGEPSCVDGCHETPIDVRIRKELEGFTADVGKLLARHMPPGYVFTLIIASADKAGARRPGATAYLSTAQRPDMVSLLREMADKLDSEKPS